MKWLTLLFLASCAGSFARVDLAKLPTAKQYPDAPAVRFIDDTTLTYASDERGDAYVDTQTHEQWRVLRSGEDGWGHIAVYYNRTFDKLLSFEARTISVSGEEKRYTLADCNDYPSRAGFELYSDSRAAVLDLPVSAGTLVEYRSVVRSKELRLWPRAKVFAEAIPSARIQLQVRHPKTWELAVTEHPSELAQVPALTRHQEGDTTVLTWTQTDAAPLPWDESNSPAIWELAPQVSVYASKWQHAGVMIDSARDEPALARYLYALTEQQAPAGSLSQEQLAKVAKENTTPDDSPRDKARKLYNWVRDNVSYCAIEIGMGGFKPHAAEDVVRLKYGDCKDKANLLRRLLAAVDVKSDMVLIHSHRGYPRQRLTLTGGNFNHAILGVVLGDTLVLTDPTSRTAPFGRLPSGDQGSPWLRLSSTGAAFARTPELRAEDNYTRVQLSLALKGNKLDGTLALEADGVAADSLRQALLDAAEGERPKRVAGHALLMNCEGSALALKSSLAPIESEPVKLQMQVSLDAPQGTSVLFRPSDVAKIGLPSFVDHGERKVPLVLRTRRHTEQRIAINLEGIYESPSLPEAVVITSSVGRYALSFKRDKGQLIIERSLTLTESVVPVSRFKEAKQFFDEALRADSRPILLKQKGAAR